MCLEWMFCNCLLVHFKLMWDASWLKLGEGVDSRYTREYLEYVQKLNLHGFPQGICGLNGVSGAIFHNAPVRVWQRSAPRGHFSEVPTSFGYFATVMVWSRCWIFTCWFVNLGEWVLIILVTQVLLIQIDWLDELQPSVEHTHRSLVNFSKFYNGCSC